MKPTILREVMLRMLRQGLSLTAIASSLDVSRQTLWRWRSAGAAHASRPSTLTGDQQRMIADWVCDHPTATQSHAADWWRSLHLHPSSVSQSTVCRALKHCAISYKKTVKSYTERNPLRVADWLSSMSHLPRGSVMALDEASFCLNHSKAYAYGLRGHRVVVPRPGRRGARYSLLVCADRQGVLRYELHPGSMHLSGLPERPASGKMTKDESGKDVPVYRTGGYRESRRMTRKRHGSRPSPAAAKKHFYSHSSKYVESTGWTLYRDSNPSLNQYQADTNVTFNTDTSGNPYPGDVLQQMLGDCYLATALRALAARSPGSIKNALRPLNGTDLQLQVNLQIDNDTYTRMNISIDDTFQETPGMSLMVYQAPSGMDIIWPTEIEKAMAKVMSLCIAERLPCSNGRRHNHKSYADLVGGDPSIAMFMLTGNRYAYFMVSDLSDTDILNIFGFANTQPIALGTSSTNTGFMYPSHAHWVVGTKGCALLTSNPFERKVRYVTLGDIRNQVDVFYVPADIDFSTYAVDLSCLNDPTELQGTLQNMTA
ncbi:g1043 [Coccomyxa elongata]